MRRKWDDEGVFDTQGKSGWNGTPCYEIITDLCQDEHQLVKGGNQPLTSESLIAHGVLDPSFDMGRMFLNVL